MAAEWAAALAEAKPRRRPRRAAPSRSRRRRSPTSRRRSGADGAGNDINMILDIPVQLTVELGRTRIPIKNILQLAQGSVVELEALAGEPMDVLVNGYLIAQGEVVVVNDKFGIRLTDIVTPSERMRRLSTRPDRDLACPMTADGLRSLLWFVAIVALIPVALWLLKRTPLGGAGGAGVMRSVATLPLSTDAAHRHGRGRQRRRRAAGWCSASRRGASPRCTRWRRRAMRRRRRAGRCRRSRSCWPRACRHRRREPGRADAR